VTVSQKQSDWYEFEGNKPGVDSRDKVKRIKENDQLFITRMMSVDEQE